MAALNVNVPSFSPDKASSNLADGASANLPDNNLTNEIVGFIWANSILMKNMAGMIDVKFIPAT